MQRGSAERLLKHRLHESLRRGTGARGTVFGREGKRALDAVDHRRAVEGTVLHQAVRATSQAFSPRRPTGGGDTRALKNGPSEPFASFVAINRD